MQSRLERMGSGVLRLATGRKLVRELPAMKQTSIDIEEYTKWLSTHTGIVRDLVDYHMAIYELVRLYFIHLLQHIGMHDNSISDNIKSVLNNDIISNTFLTPLINGIVTFCAFGVVFILDLFSLRIIQVKWHTTSNAF